MGEGREGGREKGKSFFSILHMVNFVHVLMMILTNVALMLPSLPLCSYAKIHIPIIASVSEHQPTTWTSFFFDLHVLVCVFPAGIWFMMRRLTDERVFGEGQGDDVRVFGEGGG